jgi:uncharacterized protein
MSENAPHPGDTPSDAIMPGTSGDPTSPSDAAADATAPAPVAAAPPPPGLPYSQSAPYPPGQAYAGAATGTPHPPPAAPMSPSDERQWGMLAHVIAVAATVLSGGFLGFIAALVVYLVTKDRGPFVRAHAANALNVQIIAGIAFLVSVPLFFVLIGFVTYPVAWVLAVVAHIIGAVKANNGQWWDPPLTPKFVR